MKIAKKILSLVILAFILLVVFATAYFTYFFLSANAIPLEEEKLMKNFSSIEFFYNNDNSIKSLKSSYTYTPYKDLGENTIKAFISVEDKRFFDHNGIDIIRLLKATIKNITTLSYKEGASTISQQLVKNTLLTNEKSIPRKIKEINLALRLEKEYSKEEIISMYLSAIYFGNGVYGISNAAQYYFNKTSSELSIEEAALLAGIIKAPTSYSPTRNIEKAKTRRNIVLKSMEKSNFITSYDYSTLSETDIILDVQAKLSNNDYFLFAESEVEKILIDKIDDFSGLKVYTYYDDFCEKLNEIDHSSYDGGSIVLGANGEIIYLNETKKGLNDQKGNVASLIKPLLVYGPCLEENIVTPATFINDAKTNFGDYSPSNYKNIYYGNVSLKSALSKSNNIIAVKLYNSLSNNQIKKYSSRFGIDLTENDGLSVALGATENGISPLEIASYYSVFLNEGYRQNYSTIKRIEDKDGYIVYEKEAVKQKVFSKETSFILTSYLEETVKTGTAKKQNKLPITLYAKTGTNGNDKENLECYSIAYDKNYIVLSYLKSTNDNRIPANIGGGSIPTEIVGKIFEIIEDQDSPIPKPNSILKLKIDKYLAENENIILLASEFTPNKYIFEEYFDINKAPKEYSELFSSPKIDDAKLYDENDNVILIFDSKEIYRYKIINAFTDEELFDIKGNNNEIKLNIGKLNSDIKIKIIPYVTTLNLDNIYYTNTLYKKETFFE